MAVLEGDFAVDEGGSVALDALDEATGTKDVIESNIARHFEVSRDVIHRRIEADNLWNEIT